MDYYAFLASACHNGNSEICEVDSATSSDMMCNRGNLQPCVSYKPQSRSGIPHTYKVSTLSEIRERKVKKHNGSSRS